MKTFRCEKCMIVLGEMNRGRIKTGAIVLCEKCWDKIQTKDAADKFKNLGLRSEDDTMNALKDIFR